MDDSVFSGCSHILFASDHTLIVKYSFLSTREILQHFSAWHLHVQS